MNPGAYVLTSPQLRGLTAALAGAAERAAVALVRIDERLAGADPCLAEGVRRRGHLLEAQALAHLAGERVGLEELILHDERLDASAPAAGTVRARRMLEERRRLAASTPEAVLTARAVRGLAGLQAGGRCGGAPLVDGEGLPIRATPSPPSSPPSPRRHEDADGDMAADAGVDAAVDRDDWSWDDAAAPGPRHSGRGFGDVDLAAIDRLIARTRQPLALRPGGGGAQAVERRGPDGEAEARLEAWLGVLEAGRGVPAALAAALTLDAWLALEPAARRGEVGWALAATVLRTRGLAEHHLPALGLAYRRGRFRWSPHLEMERRLAGLLAAMADGAGHAAADLQRLALARELMLRRCAGRRRGSRLHELAGLFVELPLVTTGLAAERLKVSPQAVEAMLKELGPSLPRELTGRKRYRAWGIV